MPRALFRRFQKPGRGRREESLRLEVPMNVIRAICGGSVGLAVLAIGAWAGGGLPAAQAGPGAPPPAHVAQEYPRQDQSGLIRIGDGLVVSGQPMQLSIFYTGD